VIEMTDDETDTTGRLFWRVGNPITFFEEKNYV
jgi:hypothetical protein